MKSAIAGQSSSFSVPRNDSDELREVLGAHSYAPADRDRFYGALAELAALLANQGIAVLVAATRASCREWAWRTSRRWSRR